MIKKYSKYLPFTTIFLVGLLFLFPLFKGFYQSHDSVTHVARTAAYVKAFLGGEFPPRWAADLNYGYGSPFLIFYYPLPGYVMAGLHLVGIPLEMTYRIFAGLVFILGPFFFYLWTRKKFSVHTALVATILYTCLPYRYLTLYVRGGIGEFLAFSLLPIIFYFLDSSLSNLKKLFITGLCIALLILSHNAVSLLFLPVIFLYATLQGKEKMMIAAASLLLGLLLSAFFWVPAIAEAKYTSPLFYFASWYKDHFVSLPGLIYSTWGFGSDINKSGGLSAQLGIVGFVILVISLLYVFKQKTDKRFLFLWIGISLVGLFLSTHLSYFFWDKVDFLKKFQFPWRFMVLPAFGTAALSPYLLRHIKKSWILVAVATCCIALSLSYATVAKYVTYPDSYYYNYPGSTYFHGEATTPCTEGDPSHIAPKQFEVLNGDNNLSGEVKLSTYHSVTTNSAKPVTLLDNTVYFPGWTAYVDKRQVPIQFQDVNYKGFLEISVPAGVHTVAFRFEETKIRKIADSLSLLGFALFVGSCFFLVFQPLQPHRK